MTNSTIRLSIFLFTLLSTSYCNSQSEVTIVGTVKDTAQNVIPYVDVLLKQNDSTQKLLAFASTDQYGQFKLLKQTEAKSLLVEISALAYQKAQQYLEVTQANQKFSLNFTLEDRTELLEEVEVKVENSVVVKNDTTVFNLDKLTDGTERVVIDILKKLPGFTIEPDGSYKFKGKKITRVLLDGDDLFVNNYRIGTDNINAEHISGVEAIENHEDNPLLQGLSETENVAINLQFKPGLSLSGKADIGYGHKDRYYLNTTAIAITKKLKGFSLLTYNNMGNRRSSDYFNPQTQILQARDAGVSTQQYQADSYIDADGSLSRAQSFVKNNEVFGSLNLLPKLNETTTIRLNIDYLSDKAIQENQSTTIINTDPNNPIIIEQFNKSSVKPRYFNAKTMYNKYLTNKSSIFTQFNFSKISNTQQQLGILNGSPQEETSLYKGYFIANATKYTHRLQNNSAYFIESAIAFSEKPESLLLRPGIDYATNQFNAIENRQEVYSQKQSLDLKGSYYKKNKLDHKWNIHGGLHYFKNTVNSSLIQDQALLSAQNSISYNVLRPNVKIDYFIPLEKLEIRPVISGELYNYSYTDNLNQTEKKGNQFLTDARLNLDYKFSKKHRLSARISHNETAPNEQNLYQNYILMTNRVLQQNTLNFDKLSSNAMGANYYFNDLFRDIGASAGFSYAKNNNAYLNSYVINQDVTYLSSFLQDKGAENRSVNVSLHKFVNFIRTRITLSGSLRNSHYYNLVNTAALRNNKSNTTSGSLNLSSNLIGKFMYENSFNYGKTEYYTQNSPGFINENLNNRLSLFYVPSFRFRIKGELDYTLPNIDDPSNDRLTLNTIITYENKKKSMTYKLEGMNLLNQQQNFNVNTTDYSITTSNQALFERYVLMTVSFRF
ncbi:TonB-dependent receptor [Flavobacteriaceae bacterium F08102]|nr:TonB-dependent receptor [Flavobacteriaceae bacterium F08102]